MKNERILEPEASRCVRCRRNIVRPGVAIGIIQPNRIRSVRFVNRAGPSREHRYDLLRKSAVVKDRVFVWVFVRSGKPRFVLPLEAVGEVGQMQL